MRRLLLLVTLFGATILSCSKTDIERNDHQKDGIYFSGGTEEETKGEYDPDDFNFSWDVGDKISITGRVDPDQPYVTGVAYTADKKGRVSSFSPTTYEINWFDLTSEHTFYAYYPISAGSSFLFDNQENDITISFALPSEQTQLETNNAKHVYTNTFATSSIKATPPDGNKIGFSFKHHLAFLEFHVSATANNTMAISKISATAEEGIGSEAIIYSFKNDAITLREKYKTATLTFTKAMPVTTATQKGWLAIAPGTYSKITFTITYLDGTTQVIEKTLKKSIGIGSIASVPLTVLPPKGSIDIEPAPLCKSNKLNAGYAQLGRVTLGSYSKVIETRVGYTDDIAIIAPLVKDDQIKVAIKNNSGGAERTNAIVWVDWNKDGIVTEAEIVGYQKAKSVAAGSTDEEYLVFGISAPEGILNGKYSMRFGTNYKESKEGCDNSDGDMDESRTIYDISIQYDSQVDPNAPAKGRIAAADGIQVAFEKDATANIVKTINISLTKVSETATTINLATSSSNPLLTGTLSAPSVTIPAGETLATATITFAPAMFTLDTNADITVTASSTDVEILEISKNVVYSVKGPVGKQDAKIEYSITYEDWSKIDGTITFKDENDITLIVYASGKTLNPSVPFDYEVTGTLTKEDFAVEFADENASSILYNGSGYGYSSLYVKPSAKGKTGTLTFTCQGATFAEGQTGITFTEIK